MRRWLVGAAFACASVASAVAQPKAIVCEFTSRHSANFDPRYQPNKTGERLALTFASIDVAARSAQLIGNAGAATVTLFASEGKLNFVEVTDGGNITMTSVFALVPSGDPMPAVHSRHMMMLGMALVSQFTGSCAPRS